MNKNIYERAKNNGCQFETTCVGISQYEWDKLMKGATRANRKKVIKMALQAGVIDEKQTKEEIITRQKLTLFTLTAQWNIL